MSTLNPNLPKPPSQGTGSISEGIKLVLPIILLLAVAYLFYDNSASKSVTQAQLDKIHDELQSLEKNSKQSKAVLESQVSNLKSDLASVDNSQSAIKSEIKKTAAQIQAEGQKTKREFSEALSSKADTSQVEAQVQAAKSDAETKFGQVTTEVGGVKNQVVSVRSDLDATRRDLEGTQRQLVDVRDTLNAAVAKNASELAQLRLKGERDYIEFTIQKKDQLTKVEDIRLKLTQTDAKKGKYGLKILADDSQLEKKDRLINEPLQFLVGQNRVRYEIVVNWVQKDKIGGYLSIPKDKSASAERPKAK
jgi:chromosome segregation ATPase